MHPSLQQMKARVDRMGRDGNMNGKQKKKLFLSVRVYFDLEKVGNFILEIFYLTPIIAIFYNFFLHIFVIFMKTIHFCYEKINFKNIICKIINPLFPKL